MSLPEYARLCGGASSALYVALRDGEKLHEAVQALRARQAAEAVDEEKADMAKRMRLATLVIG